jgi:inosine-uridine nucleoside N-ribohydrolase
MRLWIDTDIGDDPDDTVALWCAARSSDAQLVGVSTVDGDVVKRAALAAALLPGVEVTAGPPSAAQLAEVDVLVGIGAWTHVASLADDGALPRRVVLMGGALGRVRHRGEWHQVEHNVGRDPKSAARLLATVGNLIVVPLDATARLHARPQDEAVLVEAIPHFGEQLATWRAEHGDPPLVLHDPATVLIGLGEKIARMESRRLRVERDGTMHASIDGPLQHVVAHIDADAMRTRVRALASKG